MKRPQCERIKQCRRVAQKLKEKELTEHAGGQRTEK